jgi:DNA-binding transcriptional regulator YiaG
MADSDAANFTEPNFSFDWQRRLEIVTLPEILDLLLWPRHIKSLWKNLSQQVKGMELNAESNAMTTGSQSTAHEIKTLRKSLGLSQVDFIARLGIKIKPDAARQMVSRWERGVRKPSVAAQALLRVLAARS